MKILYCIPSLLLGGAERQVSYLATGLAELGHEVHVASLQGGPNLERLKAGGIAWHDVGGFANHDPTIFLKLVGLIRKLKPDIVQTSLAQMDILGGMAALMTRRRWVLRESSSAPFYVDGWKNSLRLALGRRADAIVSNSAGGRAYWDSVSRAGALQVIPNSVPFDEIASVSGAQTETDKFRGPEKLVLYAGRMNEGKNVETLISALARIADATPFVAILCGDGPLRPRLERMAQELGVGRRLIFAGYVTNIWALMKRADVFISVSKFEGCPNAVLEAMASGCPLIVSDIPAHREILDERTACFVSSSDPAVVASAITATLTSQGAAQQYAAAAQAQVAARTLEKTAKQYEEVYLSLLN